MQQCSCRILDIPPLSCKEVENVIEHKLSSFYPGNPAALYWDYSIQDNQALIFFAPAERINTLRDKKKNLKLFSSWHLCSSVNNKEGSYAYDSGETIDIFTFQDNVLLEVKSVESSDSVKEQLKSEGVQILNLEGNWAQNCRPLFSRKRSRSLLIPNLLLITSVFLLAQILYFNHLKGFDEYNKNLKKSIQIESIKMESDASLNREMENTLAEIERLKNDVPINIWNFMGDLSESLGTDVHISKLTINKHNFQMEATGNNPLQKMENFSDNPNFQNVIPYHIKAIEDSSRESFFLTGAYDRE